MRLKFIPFKTKAWLDLTDKKKQGLHVDDKDIKKHKNDIVRLTAILSGDEKVTLLQEVNNDMEQFISKYEAEPADLKSLRIIGANNGQIVERMRGIYIQRNE